MTFKSSGKPSHHVIKSFSFNACRYTEATLRASHEIRVVVDGEGDKRRKRKTYDCFVYEVEHNGSVYVLYAGDWYAVDKAFHQSVEDRFSALVSQHPFVASTTQTNERDFIAELDSKANLLNLDQVKLSPTGAAKANLEPCDFLSTHKQFIHLKGRALLCAHQPSLESGRRCCRSVRERREIPGRSAQGCQETSEARKEERV